jgi:hypothetical protein
MIYYPSTIRVADDSQKLFILFTKDKGLSLNADFSVQSWPTWPESPKKNCTIHILDRASVFEYFNPSSKYKSFLLNYSNAKEQLDTLSKLLVLLEQYRNSVESQVGLSVPLTLYPTKISSEKAWTDLKKQVGMYLS